MMVIVDIPQQRTKVMAVDKNLRIDIMCTVRDAMRHVMEEYEEVWLSESEFLKQFQMFNPSWLRRYGSLLPRTRVIVNDNGKEHTGQSWAYPRNKIQRMIIENQIKQLKWN